MAKKPTITTVSSGYQSTTTINNNTQNLRDAFDNTLSLDGSTPNAMQADFDMNSNDIINVDKLYISGLYIDGQPVSAGTVNYNGVIKETQVATAGQTVFNLATMVYNPGINNLSVYIDGIYQNPSTYTENNSSRITFSAGLNVGAIVDFVALSINQITGGADATSITYTPSAQSLYGTSTLTVKSALDQISNEGTGSSKVGFLQDGTGATVRTVQGKLRDYVSVKDFGAVGNGIADDTTKIQAAIDFATINGQQVFAPGGPYLLTSTLNVSCRVIGTLRNRFGTGSTFTSNVGAGVYAINYTGILGSLDSISLTNTGAGNGINVSSVSTQTAMKDVYVTTLYPITTGSGSIGVSFGSDATPGLQAITSVFDNVTSRNYDICFRMRYYSNSNIYRKFYALNTNNAGQPSTAGYLVNGRGAHFDGCLAESNFLYALNEQGGANGAEENVYTCFWAEGVSGMQLVLGGPGSLMINPYGFVGGTGGSISLPITKSAYASVIKNRGPSFSDNQINQFDSQGVNLIENAAFSTSTGGLNWGGATLSGNTIYGYNSLDIQSATPATSVTVDHLMTYLDLDVYSWLRGKTITMACFGKAETGVNMSLRAVIRTAAGSNIQYATSQSFPVGTPGYRSIAMTIPTDPADGRYIVFRITASGVTSGTPSKAGEIAVPMVYLGNKQNDITPRFLTDGADTTFGNLTFQGGGWNTSHPVLGTYHLWVDTTGDLRIKNGAPASDLDGTIVGTQL